MTKFLSFFNPLTITIICHLFVALFYDFVSYEFLALIAPSVFIAMLTAIYLNKFFKNLLQDQFADACLTHDLWKTFGLIVILVGILEIVYFGLPLLGTLIYIDFGFSFLHHIAVSSWLLIFIEFKSKRLNKIKYVYALLFPIGILNRDLFLLTTGGILFQLYLNKKLTWSRLLTAAVAFVVMFELLGTYRSGSVQDIINIPVNFDMSDFPSSFFWIFAYAIHPTFNVHFNLSGGTERDLYEPLLTVFPQYYQFIELMSLPGFYVFLIIGLVIIAIPGFMKFPGWICFSFFFYYQFTMACIFGNKLLNTHSLFVIFILLIVYISRQIIMFYNSVK